MILQISNDELGNKCDECKQWHKARVVTVGETDVKYEACVASLCAECLKKALVLITSGNF
jgi:hypothetical protein